MTCNRCGGWLVAGWEDAELSCLACGELHLPPFPPVPLAQYRRLFRVDPRIQAGARRGGQNSKRGRTTAAATPRRRRTRTAVGPEATRTASGAGACT